MSASDSTADTPAAAVSQSPRPVQNEGLVAHEPFSLPPASMAADSHPSKPSTASNSTAPSPLGSREPSPIRPAMRANSLKGPGTRSRKNSVQDLSPSRQARSNIPVPPTASRTLSAATTPTLLPASHDPNIKAPAPQKAPVSPEQIRENQWPISPRLRSPPPRLGRPSSLTRRETQQQQQEAPTINVQRATPSPHPDHGHPASESASESEEPQLQSGVRTPARSTGTLETVHEVSLPNSPGQSVDAALEQVSEKLSTELASQSDTALLNDNRTLRARPNLAATESGSESGSVKAENARRSAGAVAPPPLMARQSSAMSNKQGKGKAASEGGSAQMTVETETVTSIPQMSLAPGASAAPGNGTLKTKRSNETIKPKKEKKKPNRKQQPVGTGNASSKADIFEASIASAVDEADTSDSEETFVYDSNPPDTQDRQRRFHSRTPSATSMMSQQDRNAMRSIHSVMESAGPPVTKKTMKFANAFTNSGGDSAGGDDDGKGTGRSNAGSARGTTRQHHHGHIGRWGRGGGNGHASLFDNESPFPNAAISKLTGGTNSRHASGPTSPRSSTGRGFPNGKRSSVTQTSGYDLDDTTGADDERAPLLSSTIRSTQSRRNRRNNMFRRDIEQQSYNQQPSYLNRFAACLVVTIMLLLVVTGVIGFMFATSQPLTDIELVGIKNVLASEPELMFDLTVRAHNPNVVVVSIDQANLEIFAKSPHAGSDSEWWKNPHGPKKGSDVPTPGWDSSRSEVHIYDDPPDDPPDGDDSAPNMRLGTITEFDNPLSFEGTFFHHGMSTSTSELRLRLPGNNTAGGSERWERILQDEFDLIVKGVLRYSLPLSQRVRSAAISGRATVKPNSANDPKVQPNGTALATPNPQ